MTPYTSIVLFVVAFVLFVAAAVNAPAKYNLTAAGLAIVTLAELATLILK